MGRQKLSVRLISGLLLLAMLVGLFPISALAATGATTQPEKATRATSAGPAEDVGVYHLVESIPTVEDCFAQQGMGLLDDYIYSAQINSGNTKAVIYRTSRLTGETVAMTIDGATYSSTLGHANDICGANVGGNSYLFVTVLKNSSGNLNQIKCFKISGTELTTVATYYIYTESGTELISSGLSTYSVDGNNVTLLVTSGRVNYFGTFDVTAGDCSVTCEFAFQLDNTNFTETALAAAGFSCDSVTVQGSCYADGTFYMPLGMGHKNVPVDNHGDAVVVVLVYPNIDEAIASKNNAVTTTVEDAIRIPHPDTIWCDLESVAVEDGILYFNTTSIILDESTVTSISFVTDEYSDVIAQRQAYKYESVYLLTAPSNSAYIMVDVGAEDGHLEIQNVTPTKSAWFGFENNGQGYYYIKNMSTKLYLTVNDDGSVTQSAKTGNLNQLWAITQTGWPTSNTNVAILSLYKTDTRNYLNNDTANNNTVVVNSTGKTFALKEALNKTNLENYLFDLELYNACYPDSVGMTRAQGIAHYKETGLAEGRVASVFFDPIYYLENHPDLGLTTYQEAYDHFVNYGFWEGRQGSLFFSCNEYLHQENDANLKTGDYPEKSYYVYHFYTYGATESITKPHRSGSDEFRISEILAEYALTATDGYDFLVDYISRNVALSTITTQEELEELLFDPAYYQMKNPVLNENNSALMNMAGNTFEEKLYTHWINYGISEGRIASPYFSASYYRTKYSDVGATAAEAYTHFVTTGFWEGRASSVYSSDRQYLYGLRPEPDSLCPHLQTVTATTPKPTCSSNGLATTYCCECSTVLKTTKLAALEHTDSDIDNICDVCNIDFGGTLLLKNSIDTLADPVPINEYYDLTGCTFETNAWDGAYYMVQLCSDGVYRIFDTVNQSNIGTFPATTVTEKDGAIYGAEPAMAITLEFISSSTENQGLYRIHINEETNEGCYLSFGNNDVTTMTVGEARRTTATSHYFNLRVVTETYSNRFRIARGMGDSVSKTRWLEMQLINGTYCYRFSTDTIGTADNTFYLYKLLTDRLHTENMYATIKEAGDYVNLSAAYDTVTYNNFLTTLKKCLDLYERYNGTVLTGADLTNKDALQEELDAKERELINSMSILKINLDGKSVRYFSANMYNYNEDNMNALVDVMTGADTAGFYFESGNNKNTTAFYSVYDSATEEIVKEKTIRSQMYSITSGIAASDLSTATNPPFANSVVTTDFWSTTPIENAKDVYTDVGVPFMYEDGYYVLNSDTNAVFFEGEPTSGTNLAISERPAAYYWSGGMVYGVANEAYVSTDHTTFKPSDGYVTAFQPFAKMTNRSATAYAAEASVFEAATPVDSYLIDGVAYNSAVNPNVATSGSGEAVWGFGMKLNVNFKMTDDGCLDDEAKTPITFEFSGDDDVWVYIDGKLVLDIGGSHDAIQGVINFTDGSVIVRSDKYDRVRDKNTSGYGWSDSGKYDETQLSDVHSIITNQMYQKNLYTEVFNETIEEFANDGESHTLTVYYMDRGKGRTNSMIKFNLPQTDTITVNKDVKCATYENSILTEMSEEASSALMQTLGAMSFEYTLTDSGAAMANQTYQLFENGIKLSEQTTDTSGKFTLKDGQSAVFNDLNFSSEHTYEVVETVPTTTWFDISWSHTTTGDAAVTAEVPDYYTTTYNSNISAKVTIDGDLHANETITFNCTNTFVDVPLAADEIIVDYGKTMLIDVFENDPTLLYLIGYTRAVQGFAAYDENLDAITSYKKAGSSTFVLGSGTLSISDGKVLFTPTKLLETTEKVFAVIKYTKGTDVFYLYEELCIMPATVMYYESDFAGLVDTESHKEFVFMDFGPDDTTTWTYLQNTTVTKDTENGLLKGEITDGDPYVGMASNSKQLNYVTKSGDVIIMRMKTTRTSEGGNSTGYEVFLSFADTTTNSNWEGLRDPNHEQGTGVFEILKLTIPNEMIGRTLEEFRFDPYWNADGNKVLGTYELDYVYIGQPATAPANDYLFFDFDNGTDDQLRYKQEQYGGFNGDTDPWSARTDTRNTELYEGEDAGTKAFTAVYGANAYYIRSSTENASNYNLNHKPTSSDVLQVRFKLENFVSNGNTPCIAVTAYSENEVDANGDGKDDGFEVGRQPFSTAAFNSSEYITVTVPLSADYAKMEKLSTFCLFFSQMNSLSETELGKVTIDYIYVGKADDFNRVLIYNREAWNTVTDGTAPDFVQDSGLANNDGYLLLDFNESDRTIWNYVNTAASTGIKDTVNGVLKGKIFGNDPWVGMKRLGNQLSYTFKEGDVIQVRMKTTFTKPTTKEAGFQVYYTTRESNNYNSTKCIYDNYYEHITGEYEVITLEVGEAHFGQTIADIRFDPVVSGMGTDIDGTYEIDYVYIGPKNRAPGNDALFFDFNDNDLSQARYRSEIYGGFNGDTQAWSHGSANTSLMSGSENGAAECTAVFGKIVHAVQASTNLASGYSLSYTPKAGDVAQVRVKFENFKVSGKTFAVLGGYYGATSNSDGDAKDDGVEIVARNYIDGSWLNAGEYITLTFPINSNYTAMSNLSTFRLYFNDLTSISESQLGKITIDYIYLGPESGLPTNDRMILGYDSSYDNDSHLSNGSALYVEGVGVPKLNTDYSIKPSTYNEASFTFTGTGFDIISRTGTQQGALRAMIYDADGNYVKTVTVVNKSEKNLELYQIPVLSVDNLTHGTYQVRIFVNAAYDYGNDGDADSFGGDLDRGAEFYFDAVRIYNPIDTSAQACKTNEDSQIAYEAYLKEGEADQKLTEVRQLLIDAESFTAGGSMEGVVYLDNTDRQATIANYESYGPNNEAYLSKGSAIAFKLVANGMIPASIDIGAKSANGITANLTVSVSSAAPTAKPTKQSVTVSGSTVQYHSISIPASTWQGTTGSKYVYVTIYNAEGSGILSLTDIKYAYDSSSVYSAPTRGVRFIVDTEMIESLDINDKTEPILKEDLSFDMNITVGAQMSVGYTFMASKVADYQEFYLAVTKNVADGEPVTVTYDQASLQSKNDPTMGEPLMYLATFAGINAKEMGDTFETTLYAVAEDGTVYCSATSTASIKDYLIGKLNDENSITELKTMAVDMLKYGAAAQIRLDYNTENLVSADLTEEQLAYATKAIPEAIDYAASSGEGANVSTNITVTSRVQLSLSCICSDVSDFDALKCIITDQSGNMLAELATTNKSNIMFSAIYEDVGAKEMRKVINATFYEGETSISETVSWSVESYVAQTRAKADVAEDELNMVNAMLTYGDAVAAYMEAIA